MKVYTRIDGKLAMFEVGTDDPAVAIHTVKAHTGQSVALAVVK